MGLDNNRPCPFCGCAVMPDSMQDWDGRRGPECEGCGAMAPSLEVWNGRMPQTVQERNRALSAAKYTLKQAMRDVAGQIEQIDSMIDGNAITHVVRPGDTLSRVAVEYGVSVNDLLSANPGIASPHVIRAGDEINVIKPR